MIIWDFNKKWRWNSYGVGLILKGNGTLIIICNKICTRSLVIIFDVEMGSYTDVICRTLNVVTTSLALEKLEIKYMYNRLIQIQ